MITVARFADLAREAAHERGPLAIPLKASGPISTIAQRSIVQIAVSDVKRRFMTSTTPKGVAWRPLKYSRSRGGNKPLLDTGRLMASITGESTATQIIVKTNRPGATLHNFGGTVRPVRAKALAIPLTVQAQRAGSPRRMRGTTTTPLFARRVNGVLVGHFLLVKQVKIPAREFMGISDSAMNAIGQVLAEDVAKRWQSQTVV